MLYAVYEPDSDRFLRINFEPTKTRDVEHQHYWDRTFHFAFMHPRKCTVFEMDDNNTITKYIFDLCMTHPDIGNELQLIEIVDKEPDFMKSMKVTEYFEHYFDGVIV